MKLFRPNAPTIARRKVEALEASANALAHTPEKVCTECLHDDGILVRDPRGGARWMHPNCLLDLAYRLAGGGGERVQ
jgi:hypothetical protein